ncbi:MAG: VOC family protein [Porticoccus sp.]|nr:VOC family protein [Porticoccus sp.]
MKIEPLIIVSNVEKSSKFYQNVLGLKSAHGGDEYEMLTREGNLVLPLH